MPQTNWSLTGWRKAGPQGVTLLQAFGITKGNISFPSLTPVLPKAVSGSTSGGGKGGPKGGSGSPTPTSGSEAANAKLGEQMVAAAGWTGAQWAAFNNIVMAESGWNTFASNPSSGAYGIPQALPGSKMASAGANWQSNPATQIKWMIGYIRDRYGNPVNAWNFHLANGWY